MRNVDRHRAQCFDPLRLALGRSSISILARPVTWSASWARAMGWDKAFKAEGIMIFMVHRWGLFPLSGSVDHGPARPKMTSMLTSLACSAKPGGHLPYILRKFFGPAAP